MRSPSGRFESPCRSVEHLPFARGVGEILRLWQPIEPRLEF